MNRIDEIHQLTLKEIKSGDYDIYDYIPIMYGLKQEEDYEAMEGIKRAVLEFGMILHIPDNEDELI